MIERYLQVRAATEALAEPLSAEDQQLQSMPSCSPVKWHRAHTTWFFETLVLGPSGVAPFRPEWGVLFNSYYEALGPRHPRAARGMLSRPTVDEVGSWRRQVDEAMVALIAAHPADDPVFATIELGLAHEEQHQELILTDILHALSLHPHEPAYRGAQPPPVVEGRAVEWLEHDGGVVQIGHQGPGFAFDNEGPRHKVWVDPFALADRLVTIEEWSAFAAEGGYSRPDLWLSEGWDWVRREGIDAPAYTRREGADVLVYTLDGPRKAEAAEPVRHLSFYEADALARFLQARLPTEAEWEVSAAGAPVEGNFREDGWLTPRPAGSAGQRYGDVWQWTASPYSAYPGFRAPPGAVGEYNGKFMVNQVVLRGGSCFTPRGHVRATYRNFWHPDTRFQMTGLRLARDAA